MVDSLRDRIDGAGDKGSGNAKEAFGKLTGDESMEREGQADQAKGEAKDVIADVKDKVGDVLDKIKGK
jgi:uncharacterized protein YjbJ (UPF0337 family)